VIRYQLPRALTCDELLALQQGLGLQIETGLGMARVNPTLLADGQPTFKQCNDLQEVSVRQAISKPNSPLVSALIQRLQRKKGDERSQYEADRIFTELCRRVVEARRFAAVPGGVCIAAPTSSQWGGIKQHANSHRTNPTELWHVLANDNNGVLTRNNEWALRFSPYAEHTLGQYLRDALAPLCNEEDFPRLIGHLAVLGLEPAWLEYCLGRTEQEAAL
jgi:hypothetical protein